MRKAGMVSLLFKMQIDDIASSNPDRVAAVEVNTLLSYPGCCIHDIHNALKFPIRFMESEADISICQERMGRRSFGQEWIV